MYGTHNYCVDALLVDGSTVIKVFDTEDQARKCADEMRKRGDVKKVHSWEM